jgi:hypothetical protein
MKNIANLVADINAVVGSLEDGALAPSSMDAEINQAYAKQMCKRPAKVRTPKTIYFSEMGDVCLRRLWYRYHKPELSETLTPATKVKFLYGDILESLVLQLARDAGHDVKDEQKQVEYVNDATGWSVRGRIDATIDGVVVDVKSVTKQSERKFHDGLADDPFGYYGQLNGYASVLKSEEMGFLTIQKELGHIHYFPFIPDAGAFAYGFARAVKAIDREAPVVETLDSVPQSKTSANMKLCTNCSYCSYKRECFPSIRAFAYAGKVEWLTKVVDVPRVPEIDLNAPLVEEEE